MIVITGASGQLGQHVITELLKKTAVSNLVAAVRNVGKAQHLAALGVQVREADYDRPDTLDSAFRGAEKILLISSSAVGQRVPQHRNVIAAAKRAGVKLIAYTSVLRAETSVLGLAEEHRVTEADIRASGLPYTMLRNGWYLENYAEHLDPVLAHGAVLGAAGEGRVSAAARVDYAAAAAAVLTAPAAPEAVYELAGETSFSLAELAAEVARQSGKEIVYNDMPQAQFKSVLLEIGVPETMAQLLSDSDASAKLGALEGSGAALRALIGRPTATLAEALKAALKK